MSINLSKGQTISLEKSSGSKLSNVTMGLGWDVAKKKSGGFFSGLFGGGQPDSVDLDASCVMFSASGEMIDSIWFRQLRSKDGSIQHTGDNLTGEGDGDDEKINVNLSSVPSDVKYLVFVVNSFTGQNFSQIDNAFCRLVDQNGNKEIAKYNLSCQGNHTGMIMVRLQRDGSEWNLTAIGQNTNGRTFADLLPDMKRCLG